MKTQTLFIAVLLVTVSWAETLNPASSSSQVLAELNDSPFGRGMLSLLKVHMSVGNAVNAIVDLLDQITAHIESERDWDSANWDTTKATLNSIISDADAQLTQSTGQLATLDSQITAKQTELQTAQTHVSESGSEVARLTGKVGEQGAFIEAEQLSFDQRQQKDQDAIDACNAALGLLAGFCGDQPQASFIQIQSNDLEEVTNKFRALGQDSTYLPLINALTMLAETGDGATVEEVVALITELRDEISRSRAQDGASFPGNMQGWQATLGDYQTQLTAQQTRFDTNSGIVTSAGAALEQLNGARTRTLEIQADAQAALDENRPLLANGQRDFSAREALRAQQLQLISKVKQAFVQDPNYVAEFFQIA